MKYNFYVYNVKNEILMYSIVVVIFCRNMTLKKFIIMLLQIIIINCVMIDGWTISILNGKQLELTKKYDKSVDYDKFSENLIFSSVNLLRQKFQVR